MKKAFFLFLLFFLIPQFSAAKKFTAEIPKAQEVVQSVLEASVKTRVRPPLLYALYGQETGYGTNLGKTEQQWNVFCSSRNTSDCRSWKIYDCKPGYSNAEYYGEILKKLGFVDSSGNPEKKEIPTSSTCALGFTQFEPRTWKLVATPRGLINPWNIKEAMLASAYYLDDLGADDSEVLREGRALGAKDKIALQKYYCGSNFQRSSCRDYADSVEIRAQRALEELLQAGYRKQLERLEEERKILQRELRVAVPLGCEEVSTENFGFGTKRDLESAKMALTFLDNTTRDLSRTFRLYRDSKDKDILSEVQQFAESRKKYLVESAYRDPDGAIFQILLEEDRKEIGKITPRCTEEEVTLEGLTDVLHIDFEEGSSQTQYVLITDDGTSYTLHPAKGLWVPLESGMRIRVKGIKIDQEILFDGTRSLKDPHDFTGGIDVLEEAGNPPVTGEQKVMVVMVYYENTSEPPLTKEAVRNVVFGEADRYYREISYNKIFLSGEVLGWYKIPLRQSCDYRSAVTQAVKQVDASVDFRNYSRLLVIAPLGPSCGWGGIATTGKTPLPTGEGVLQISYAAIRSNSVNLLTVGHELGHNFGDHHADSLFCKSAALADSGCTYTEYGDRYDIMGKKNTGHMNALHKEHLGWLGANTLTDVKESGTYVLRPLEEAGETLKALKIQRKVNDFLYIEYRRPLGYDGDIGKGSNVFQGAILHVRKPDGDPKRSALIDPTPPGDVESSALLPGMTFQDPSSGAIITAVSRDNNSLTLKVVAGKKDFTPPSVSITSPSGQPTLSGKITVSASASHRLGLAGVDFYYVAQGEQTRFASDKSAPYEVELDTSLLPQGLNYVFAKARDSSGNEGVSILAGFYVTLPDREPPEIILRSPENGTTLQSPVLFAADATDDSGVSYVVFKVDVGTENEQPLFIYKAPYKIVNFLKSGFHTVYAEARDLSGKVSRSPTVSFSVSEKGALSGEMERPGIIQPELPKKIIEKKARPALPETIARLPEGTVGVSYSATLTATEGAAPFIWEIRDSSRGFPPGLGLARETGVISGVPKEDGVWSFLARYTDKEGKVGVREFGLEIKKAIFFIGDLTLPSGLLGKSYRTILSASGSNPPFKWGVPTEYGRFPPGLSLESNGVISGTPTEAGTWVFSVKITDNRGGSSIEEMGIEIKSAISIKTQILPSGFAGTFYSASLEVSGAGTPPFRWSVPSGNFPPGLSLDPLSGSISGNPSEAGSWTFTVKVADIEGSSASRELKIEIRTPLKILDQFPVGTVGVQYKFTPSVTGGKPPYVWKIEQGNLPPDFSLEEKTGEVVGTPAKDGSWDFLLSVRDENGIPGSRWMTITIASRLEIITSVFPTLTAGWYFGTSTQAQGGVYPYKWSVFSGDLPLGLTFTDYGYIYGSPNKDGKYSLTFKVSDASGQTAIKNFEFGIKPQLTLSTSSLPYAAQGVSYSTSVAANGGTPPYTWSVSSGELPAGITLDNSGGAISGVPQESGSKSFAIKVKDALGVETSSSFWIQVRPPLSIDTQSFLNGSVGIYYGTSTRISGGTYPYSRSIISGSLPSGLSFATSSGYISGTPSSEGIWNFTLEVKDASGLSVTRDFTLEIKTQLKIISPATYSSATVGVNYSTSSAAIGGTPPYKWNIVQSSLGTLPAGLELDNLTGIISGTPAASGKAEFYLRAEDSQGVSLTRYFSITINSASGGVLKVWEAFGSVLYPLLKNIESR